MTSLRRLQRTSTSLVAFGTALALVAVGCSGKEKEKSTPDTAVGGSSAGKAGGPATNSGGRSMAISTAKNTGGTTAQGDQGGTTSEDGGATTSEKGGATSEKGGTANSEGGTTAESSQATGGGSADGGSAGSSSTIPDITCESDITCKASGLLCDVKLKKCVECLKATDCRDDKACVAGVCGGAVPAGCKKNADCESSADGKICDATRGRCVGCMAAVDCPQPSTSECVDHACVSIAICTNSRDCTDEKLPVCKDDVTPGHCVQCVRDEDCTTANQGDVCSGNRCFKSCTTESDCSGGQKCNTSSKPNFCAECATHSDCPAEKFCNKGTCAADICEAGKEQACVNNGIATCSADGDEFGKPKACSDGETCSVGEGRASCGGGGQQNPTECATDPGTVRPCSKIPKFTGTQTVDGKGDDFCSVPSFELNFGDGTIEGTLKNDTPKDQFKQRAIAQVAWSDQGVHAFIKVLGTPVTHAFTSNADKPWDGDSIELMITSNNDLKGLTSEDTGNALHFIMNYAMGVTVRSTGDSGAHTQITDASQFKGMKTDDGYVVELKYPWPGTAPASETEVRFDLAMNVDLPKVGTDPGRDGQVILAKHSLGEDKSSCSGDPALFCDDRLWCPTKLE